MPYSTGNCLEVVCPTEFASDRAKGESSKSSSSKSLPKSDPLLEPTILDYEEVGYACMMQDYEDHTVEISVNTPKCQSEGST